MTQEKRHYNLIIALVLVVLVAVGLITVSSTLAWLHYRKDKSGTVVIGGVNLQAYYNGFEIDTSNTTSVSTKLGAVNTAKLVDLKLRNTGQISALVRARITISTTSAQEGQFQNYINNMQASLSNTVWVNDFATSAVPGLTLEGYSGEMYLNVVLNPYSQSSQEVSIIDSITPIISDLANKDIYIFLSFEAIPYDGNPYKTGQGNVPWQSPPSAWTAYN